MFSTGFGRASRLVTARVSLDVRWATCLKAEKLIRTLHDYGVGVSVF